MGQVFGKNQSYLNNPVNTEREWISIEEQKRRFRVHKAADIYLGLGKTHVKNELFDPQIAFLIADYTMDDKWSKACELYGQEEVLSFPEKHMSEIGDPDSVFYFIPTGTLNEFEEVSISVAHNILGIQENHHPLQFRAFWPPGPQEHGNHTQEAKWALMNKELLEDSRDERWERQEELAARQGIAIPSIHTVAKILFQDIAVQIAEENKVAKEGKENVKREKTLFPRGTYTRVIQETDSWHLIIGGSDSNGVGVYSVGDSTAEGIGLAVVHEF